MTRLHTPEQQETLIAMNMPVWREDFSWNEKRIHQKLARTVLRFADAREQFQERLLEASSAELKTETLESTSLHTGSRWLGSQIEFGWLNATEKPEIAMYIGPRSLARAETFAAIVEPDKIVLWQTYHGVKDNIEVHAYDPMNLFHVASSQPHIFQNAVKLSEQAMYIARKLA